jgi:hypothetical protein
MPQLYNLKTDLGETKNVAAANPQVVHALASQLKVLKEKNGSR